MDVLHVLFSLSTIAATLSMAVPLLFVSMGGLLTKQAGIEDIGLEGLMLIGCFSGFAINYFTHSWVMGILGAMIFTTLFSLLFGVFVISLHAHEIVAGVAINVMGSGLTTYLLRAIFGVKGSFTDPRVVAIPQISFDFLKNIPWLDKIINGQSVLLYVALLLLFLINYMLYSTRFGYYIRAAGENEKALASAGVNVVKIRYLTILLHGALCGLGGVFLSTGYLTQYVENMSAGRGFIAMAAYAFGMAMPMRVFGSVMLFAFVQSLSNQLQICGYPSYFTNMIPYFITVVVLAATSYYNLKKKREVLRA